MLEVREVLPEDVPGVQKVFRDTWLATYPNEECGITREDIEDRYKDALAPERIAKRQEAWAHLLPDEKIFSAIEDGAVVGVCRVKTYEDKNQLHAIYVLPEYQGKGIGSALWEKALTFFDPSKDIYVGVAVYNQKAIDFYSRLGFVDTEKRFKDENLKLKSGAMIPEMEMRLSR